MMKAFLLISYLISVTISKKIDIDFIHPLLLLNQPLGIKSMLPDYSNNLMVTYVDGSGTVFDNTFSAVRTTYFAEPVDSVNFFKVVNNTLTLSNGSSILSYDLIYFETLSNNLTKHSYYNYDNFNIIGFNDVLDNILDYKPWYFSSNNVNSSVLFSACTNTIKISIDGSPSTIVTFNHSSNGVYATEAFSLPFLKVLSPDEIKLTVRFFVCLSNNTMYRFDAIAVMRFSYITQRLEGTLSSNRITINTLPENIVKITHMTGTNSYILQGVSKRLFMLNSTNYAIQAVASSIYCETLVKISTIFSNNYLFCSTSMIEIVLLSGLNDISPVQNIPLPFTANNLIKYSSIYFLYRLDFGELYKIYPYPCYGSMIYDNDNTTCTSFNISVANCQVSIWLPEICNQCQETYDLTSNYTCSKSQTTLLEENEWIQLLLTYLLEIFEQIYSQIISIPGARCVVTPLFYYFTNFDDLYFYQFHDRIYGETIAKLFKSLGNIETSKWGFIDYSYIFDSMNFNSSELLQKLDYQSQYLTYNFTSHQSSLGSEGLFANNINFFFINLPCVLILFIFLRFFFFLLFEYHLSSFIRCYALWGYFFLICLQGNFQQFTYFLTNDLLLIFAFNPWNKIIKLMITVFGFCCLMGSISLFVMCYSFYGKLNKYLLENQKNRFQSIIVVTVQNGIYTLLMGSLHVLLRFKSYENQIIVFICCQIIFCVFYLLSSILKVYRIQFRVIVVNFQNILRILLLFCFYFDRNSINNFILQQAEGLILVLMITIFMIGVSSEIIFLSVEIIRKIRKMIKQNEIMLPLTKQQTTFQDSNSKNPVVKLKEQIQQPIESLKIVNSISKMIKTRRFRVRTSNKILTLNR